MINRSSNSETTLTHSSQLVIARGIGIRRGKRWIVRHIDTQICRGELVMVIGANGAGKSTFSKSILGLTDIDEGTIIRKSPMKVGYVPQRLTVQPTLPFSMKRLMNLTQKHSPQDIDRALSAVGLEKLDNPPVATLSSGEFQRLLLARAMIERPDLLVLDEPAQGVDMAGTAVLHKLILQIRDELNCGVLMVSHDLEKVLDYGDEVIVLIPHEHDDKPLRS